MARTVLDNVVKKTGLQTGHVHVHFRKLARDQKRMDHVRLAGGALLIFVALRRETVGLFQRSQIFVWTELAQASFKLAVKLFYGIGQRCLCGDSYLGRVGRHGYF